MSNLTPIEVNHVSVGDIADMKKMCQELMSTPHYSKMGADGMFAVVSRAKSLGMDPVSALNGELYYVQGRVGMSTEAMASRMRSAGHSITKDPKSDDSVCILHGKRADNGDEWTVKFSIEDAKRAGIYKPGGPWGKYPGVMCYNRALSMLFRQLTPDLSRGAGYTHDELHEIAGGHSGSSGNCCPEEIKHEVITEEQKRRLQEIVCRCDSEHVEKLMESLQNNFKVYSWEEIPNNLFERIETSLLKNARPLEKEEDVIVEEIERVEGN